VGRPCLIRSVTRCLWLTPMDGPRGTSLGGPSAEVRYGRGFGIVEGYGGHGIGRRMHMEPFLPNEGSPGRGPLLAPGSVLAIEPMLTLATGKTVVLDDGWTVITADGSRAARWKHTVAVTEDGPRNLTVG
jgi:methionyl aminopeptidase